MKVTHFNFSIKSTSASASALSASLRSARRHLANDVVAMKEEKYGKSFFFKSDIENEMNMYLRTLKLIYVYLAMSTNHPRRKPEADDQGWAKQRLVPKAG